jgi:quercetin dioxygenase-like cupin family protein
MPSRLARALAVLALGVLSLACSRSAPDAASAETPATGTPAPPRPALPAEPVVNHTASDAAPGEKVEHGELIAAPDEARKKLHAQHHPHGLLETRRVPGRFAAPSMKEVRDYYLSKKDLDVIHPGPGEYVHVMEGQRHGYKNLTIGITYTAPGGAPPMHTHMGEESHVLTSGQKVLYALGEEMFVATGPYVINIPPMTPHSFQNLDDRVAELVVIFPTNVWEYDVLDYFPFSSARAKDLAQAARRETAAAKPAAD